MIRRGLVVLVVFVIAVVTYPGVLLVSLATRLSPAPPATAGPAGALPWLHVAHPSSGMPYIADEHGRLVLLHGAIPAGLLQFGPGTQPMLPVDPSAYEDGRCPVQPSWSRYPPLCRADLQAMAALGFNSIRLPLSWSALEPTRGHFDEMYIDRVAQVVDWARQLRMYVVVDMHQNGYSYFVGAGPSVNPAYLSGAPEWATVTDGFPSHVYRNMRELNPAVFEAATNFWYDRNGIQDEYIAALAHVAARFKDDSVVVGYGVYNEPWPGWNLSPGFEDLLLFPFYRRVIDAITGARDGLPCWSGFFMPATCGYRDLGVDDRRHLMFLDTGLVREVTDFPTHLGLPISSYPNLVLALHAYTHIYTIDALRGEKVPNTDYPWGGYDQSYDFAEREAKAMDAALFVAEFGDDPADDELILKSQLLEQEKRGLGFAFWTWTESGGTWGMFDTSSGCLRAGRERLLARAYPRATADTRVTFHYDSDTGGFALTASGRPGDAPTIVYVPPEVRGPISSEGAAATSTVTAADGSRLITASPTGGKFGITIAPAPIVLTGCS